MSKIRQDLQVCLRAADARDDGRRSADSEQENNRSDGADSPDADFGSSAQLIN